MPGIGIGISPHFQQKKSLSSYCTPLIGYNPEYALEALDTPTIYLDSAATGAANGTSWANAYTTFAAAHTAASDGSVIEVSGGASGKTYTLATTITKDITIQGSRTEGHDGLVTFNGPLNLNNGAGGAKFKNFKHMLATATGTAVWFSQNCTLEAYDMVFGPYESAGANRLYDGCNLKFTNCKFLKNQVTSTHQSTFLLPLTGASTLEYNNCIFYSGCGQSDALIAGSTLKIYNCTQLQTVFNAGNSATTTVDIKNSAFMGGIPLVTGASSKAPTVENVFWHKSPSVTGSAGDYTTFDTSNKATITGEYKDALPYFENVKDSLIGELILRWDDTGNIDDVITAAATLNPEVKVTFNVNCHGTVNKPTSTQIDKLRTLVAGGNEIAGHGSSHSSLSKLDCIVISATGTSPTLDITVTQAGDSSTWTGTLSVTINSITEDFDLTSTSYNTIGKLVAALNGNSVGDGVVTATKKNSDHNASLLSLCLDAVTAQSISANYTCNLDEDAFVRFEVAENILDIESYINSATDRNGNNAVAGTTVAAPSTSYVVHTYATANGLTRPAVATLLQSNENIYGASAAAATAQRLDFYYWEVAVSNFNNMYGSTYEQASPTTSSEDLFAMACTAAVRNTMYMPLFHVGVPNFGGTLAGLKTMLTHFGVGSRTFAEYLNFIRTDGAWTITEPNAAFTDTWTDYLMQGDFRVKKGSPLCTLPT